MNNHNQKNNTLNNAKDNDKEEIQTSSQDSEVKHTDTKSVKKPITPYSK